MEGDGGQTGSPLLFFFLHAPPLLLATNNTEHTGAGGMVVFEVPGTAQQRGVRHKKNGVCVVFVCRGLVCVLEFVCIWSRQAVAFWTGFSGARSSGFRAFVEVEVLCVRAQGTGF